MVARRTHARLRARVHASGRGLRHGDRRRRSAAPVLRGGAVRATGPRRRGAQRREWIVLGSHRRERSGIRLKEKANMTRPITLFTGQWADLPFEEVARLAGEWGFDGLEIASWGDHLDVSRWDDDDYVQGRHDILEKNGLQVWTISNHLVGQAVCDDPIDARHRDIVPDRVWGDGEPEGVRRRAAEEMKDTARMAAKLGVKTVTG